MFTGSLVALITPFKNGSVDEKGFEKFVAWQIKEGTDGLVPCGTTGESPTDPFLNGVINATSDPVNMASSDFFLFSDFSPPQQRGATCHCDAASACVRFLV